MSDPEIRKAGLAMLLVDVLSGEDEDAELLLRYARDPASLRPAKREQVERRLAASPAYADQLRVLRRLSAELERPISSKL